VHDEVVRLNFSKFIITFVDNAMYLFEIGYLVRERFQLVTIH